MAAMPRPANKARKIAYKILGVPANIKYRRSETEERINRRLLFEETARVR